VAALIVFVLVSVNFAATDMRCRGAVCSHTSQLEDRALITEQGVDHRV
jgi:hypothetical protein